jgi:Arc/MetJ family transcription regulator
VGSLRNTKKGAVGDKNQKRVACSFCPLQAERRPYGQGLDKGYLFLQQMISLYLEDIMARTVINLNDRLLRKAQRLTGLKKKVAVVNLALERLVRQKEIEKLLELPGSVEWEGDLREMRKNRLG